MGYFDCILIQQYLPTDACIQQADAEVLFYLVFLLGLVAVQLRPFTLHKFLDKLTNQCCLLRCLCASFAYDRRMSTDILTQFFCYIPRAV